ncbi:unnamed protein product, partial [Mesorhabditis belari]|uniref:Uncharacterized protein n=1 Tax=Mesorhabditis belari TaxID=2138241 RepID=A0AAF3FNC1_9BILA
MPRKSAHSSREPRPDDCPIQILGSDGNVITVPSSILTQAGINIRDSEELTHQQVANVLSLMNADQSESHQSTSADERTRKRSHSLDMNRSEQNSQQATFTINGTDDGGLELIDSTTGRHFYLSPSQLEENGITIENGELSHDELTQIIQMTVNMGQGEGNERDGETGIEERRNLPPAKRSKEGYQKAGASRANTLGHQVEFRRPSGSADVGDKVQFKRAGKVQEAIVRYIRSQAGYKVQFDDGHFEWIDEGDLINQSDHRDHQR